MAIDVTSEVVVRRPRDEVAAFVTDPANDLAWIRALSESTKQDDAPVAAGTRVRRTARMLGRSMPYTTEVTALDAGRSVSMRTVDGPFPMLVDYLFEEAEGGTRVRVRNRGGSGPLFSAFGWLVGRMVKSRVDGDLRALKTVLES